MLTRVLKMMAYDLEISVLHNTCLVTVRGRKVTPTQKPRFFSFELAVPVSRQPQLLGSRNHINIYSIAQGEKI